MSMTTSSHWTAIEEAIARLLPGGSSFDRPALLVELAAYAQAVVREARGGGQTVAGIAESPAFPAWLAQPVFICGCHRSGTTLLQRLLDGHPELLVLPSEATYFTSFRYAARADPRAQDTDRFMAEWLARFVDPNDEPHFKLGRTTPQGNPAVFFCRRLLIWQAALRRARPDLANFALLLALVAAFKDVTAPGAAPRMWVEKTPLNETNLHRLSAFPDARYIQLVREPGATLASLRARYRAAGHRDFDAADHVRRIGRSLHLASVHSRNRKDRYLIVRYEDLINDPFQEMEQVREFLGIAANSSLLKPTSGGLPVRSNSSFEPSSAGSIARIRTSVSPEGDDSRIISASIRSAAQAFGYEILPLNVLGRIAIQLRLLPRRVLRGARRWLAGILGS